MVVAGARYIINSLALFLAPALAEMLFPYVLLPCLVAEVSLDSWLLVKGIRVDRMEHAGPSAGDTRTSAP